MPATAAMPATPPAPAPAAVTKPSVIYIQFYDSK